MPNPRYLTNDGEPTVELLRKLTHAKKIFTRELDGFCDSWGYDPNEIGWVENIYLIGSHAEVSGWTNDTSDLDLKIINSKAFPQALWDYKRRVLDPCLCEGDEKRKWIDIFFARRDDQVLYPRWELTEYWDNIDLNH
ncbi:hypothetical protein HOD75_02900 [archaeon]|jgi:hypothetical protein|nr:hypothetical protein [archaeon]MBT4241822.1 hypothetical protein [archaeon]MBT4418370.1 hypothetical protein [archaeon]